MTALEFVADLLARGVVFTVDGDRLRCRRIAATSPGERSMISALKPLIVALIRTEVPPELAPEPCAKFEAHAGVALCRECGYTLPAHFWRRSTCEFFVGAPAATAICRRCGVPWLEHAGSPAAP